MYRSFFFFEHHTIEKLGSAFFFLRLGGSFITYFTGVIFAKYFCNFLVQLSVVLVTNKCAWCELLRWLQKSGVSNKLMWLNYQKKIWLRVYHRVPFIHSAGEQRGGKICFFNRKLLLQREENKRIIIAYLEFCLRAEGE